MDLNILAMLVWTGSGSVLLFVLMYVDSLFTKYKDFAEVKAGNMAVTTRMVMKLFAQGYVLATSISTAGHLGRSTAGLRCILYHFVDSGECCTLYDSQMGQSGSGYGNSAREDRVRIVLWRFTYRGRTDYCSLFIR